MFLCGWCSGNALDLCPAGSRLESRPHFCQSLSVSSLGLYSVISVVAF
jgi:hypothetical protein